MPWFSLIHLLSVDFDPTSLALISSSSIAPSDILVHPDLHRNCLPLSAPVAKALAPPPLTSTFDLHLWPQEAHLLAHGPVQRTSAGLPRADTWAASWLGAVYKSGRGVTGKYICMDDDRQDQKLPPHWRTSPAVYILTAFSLLNTWSYQLVATRGRLPPKTGPEPSRKEACWIEAVADKLEKRARNVAYRVLQIVNMYVNPQRKFLTRALEMGGKDARSVE